VLFGRRRLPGYIYDARERYFNYDPLEIGLRVAVDLLRFARSIDPADPGEALQRVTEVKRLYAFNGIVVRAASIVEAAVEAVASRGLGRRGLRRILDSVAGELPKREAAYLRESASSLVAEVLVESRLLLASPSRVSFRAALALRAKAGIVRVPEAYPLARGVDVAEALHGEGVRAVYVPDFLRARIVRESDMVIVPVYGVTGDGLAVADAGAAPVVEAAWEHEKRVYLVGVESSLQETLPSEELLASPPARLGEVAARPFDLLDPDAGPLRLARRAGSIAVDRGGLSLLARAETRKVLEAITSLAGALP